MVVVENEVTYLALPPVTGAVAVWGKGYSLVGLRSQEWLTTRRVLYSGDIDTHGFAILDRLRASVPHVESMLMDRPTLIAHRDRWGREPSQSRAALPGSPLPRPSCTGSCVRTSMVLPCG